MSEIKVNKISQRSGTAITLGNSGTDFQLPSGADIVAQSGSTITIAAGATITNSGTASGFGPTGAVSWNTTKITANPNPAVSGVGYFCDTSSASFTVTLPAAPSAGAIVALSDYTGTWTTNNLTVGRNSSNINGAAADLLLNENNTTATLIYVDATEGWRVIDTGSLSEVNIPKYVVATGGTVTCCGNYKIHTFTGPGTFTVSCAGNSQGSNSVDYLVIAGGGGAGGSTNPGGGGGGGGAGGYRESVPSPAAWTASPLANPGGALPVSVTGYPITVGGGGSPKGPGAFVNGTGSNSVFSTITSAGGGAGGMANPGTRPATIASNGSPSTSPFTGGSGGSGGGAGFFNASLGGKGNEPPVAPSQGNSGGSGSSSPQYAGGGGGGAGAVGANATPTAGANGGNGVTSSITGSPVARGGGGGGASSSSTDGSGGTGGGGNGTSPGGTGGAGGTNTGGGGGGGGSASDATGGAGGSGLVIIRYKFQ